MIPVQMPPEPPDFDALVRQPGHGHLRKKSQDPAHSPPSGFQKRYGNRCVYSCFYLSEERVYAKEPLENVGMEHPQNLETQLAEGFPTSPDGQERISQGFLNDNLKHSIDHFQPISQSPMRLIYEWSNLRWS